MKAVYAFKTISAILCLLIVAGCSGAPPAPDWTYASFNKLEDFKRASLEGRTAIAALHFQHAVEELKKSGDLKLMATVYLNRGAVQTALLEPMDDDDFRRLQALQPDPENASFHAFLKGNFPAVDVKYLPAQYTAILADIQAGQRTRLAGDVREIIDPLSRLVATGRLTLSGYENEEILSEAVATASRQGWKKALLIYLHRLQLFYETRQELEKANKIIEKIKFIQ